MSALVGDSEKKATSLRLEKQVLKRLKRIALEKDTSVQQLLETLIDDYLRKNEGEGGRRRG